MHPQTISNASYAFDLRALESAIAGTEFAGDVLHFSTVASTNELASQAALAGARVGVWIADEQTAGRGRGAHTWHSAAGDGLYMTALIAPPIPMQSALSLSLRVALAVQSAIASTFALRIPADIDIRWPNDLMLTQPAGPAKKVGGILIDTASNPATSTQPASLRYAILGIGINVNHLAFPPELEPTATSIRRALADHASEDPPVAPLRREPLAAAILVALDAEVRALTTDTLQPATQNLSRYSTWITGKRVRVEPRDGVPGYMGTTAGLNPAGFLLVTGDDGQLHTILSGGLREA
jgi:BirA family biotin operon repressor/biotin-[acetyl-CoA-carboxylase] ligase